MIAVNDAVKSEVLAEVCLLLDREAEKFRTNYDLKTAEVIEVLRAKVRALAPPR